MRDIKSPHLGGLFALLLENGVLAANVLELAAHLRNHVHHNEVSDGGAQGYGCKRLRTSARPLVLIVCISSSN